MAEFDPYLEWLGIPTKIRPLNHYLILGIKMFESDETVIVKAFEIRLEQLRKYQTGPRGEISQVLASEVSQAKQVLSNESKREAYNAQLTLNNGEQPVLSKAIVPIDDEKQSASSQAPSDELTTSENDSIEGGNLKDIRMLMALISLSVVVMTVTIVWLRGNPRTANTNSAGNLETAAPTELASQSASKPTSEYKLVPQKADGSITIPLGSARIAGNVQRKANELSDWKEDDQATWLLSTPTRRKGYFDVEVTYTANRESRFSIQFDKKKLRFFTLYPHETQFTEKLIARVAKKEEQLMTIVALQGNPAGQVKIVQIRISPTD